MHQLPPNLWVPIRSVSAHLCNSTTHIPNLTHRSISVQATECWHLHYMGIFTTWGKSNSHIGIYAYQTATSYMPLHMRDCPPRWKQPIYLRRSMIHLNLIASRTWKPAFQLFHYRSVPHALRQKHTKSPSRNASPTTHHPERAYLHYCHLMLFIVHVEYNSCKRELVTNNWHLVFVFCIISLYLKSYYNLMMVDLEAETCSC